MELALVGVWDVVGAAGARPDTSMAPARWYGPPSIGGGICTEDGDVAWLRSSWHVEDLEGELVLRWQGHSLTRSGASVITWSEEQHRLQFDGFALIYERSPEGSLCSEEVAKLLESGFFDD